jgi:hypothetical protein
MNTDPIVPIVASFVTGLLALAGGFFGAWLARKSDYDKWLRQERSSAFGEFLRQLHETWLGSMEALNDARLSDSEADQLITKKFVSLESQQNIVRLYLREKDRAGFTNLVHSLWVAQTRTLNQGKRIEATRELMSEIQKVLEQRLHD